MLIKSTLITWLAYFNSIANSYAISKGDVKKVKMSEEVQGLFIDNESGMIKAGISRDDTLRAIFPSVIGCYKRRVLDLRKCFHLKVFLR